MFPVVLVMAGIFFSCSNDMEQVKRVTMSLNSPEETSEDFHVIFTDSGFASFELFAGIAETYIEPKKVTQFKDGLKVLFFDKEGNEYTIWYVPQLNFPILSNFDIGKNSKIPGAMAEFEMIQEGFIMRFTLMSYSDKVDNPNAFDMTAPDGYTEMSAEVLKQFGL